MKPAPSLVPISTQHFLRYDTTSPVSARTLAESLLGLEAIVADSKPVISYLLGDQYVKDIDVLITKIEIGSYNDSFIVRLVFGKGRAGEKRIEDLRKALKFDKMDPKKAVGLAIAAAILYVAYQYAKPGEPARIQIENSFNQIGTGTNLSGEDIRGIIEGLLGQPRRADLKKQVSRLLHPGGGKHEGTIQLDNDPLLVIPKEAISSVPAIAVADVEEDPIADFPNTQIVVRAMDLDSASKGWWAIVPSLSDSRVQVHLVPGINPNKVPIGRYFQADVTVTYAIGKNAVRKPKNYLLSKIYDEADALRVDASQASVSPEPAP